MLWVMRWFSVALFAGWMSGCTSAPDLRVDLRTDYVGGVEFETALVSLDGGAFETVQLDHRANYVSGVRLIKYDGLDPGTRRVVVRLMLGTIQVAERAAVVSLQETSAVTVVMTRSCWGVSCDPGQVCLGGACVDETCNPETPTTCTDQCSADADCGGGSVDCLAGRCVDGVCLLGDSGSCGSGLFCHPDIGCASVGSASCPPFMQEVDDFCIDVFQSGNMTWIDATAYCEERGASLCNEEEWFAGCNSGELDAIFDDWEWTSVLVSETDALKHGSGDCEATSPHTIDDGDYGVRCCAPR